VSPLEVKKLEQLLKLNELSPAASLAVKSLLDGHIEIARGTAIRACTERRATAYLGAVSLSREALSAAFDSLTGEICST
jgi:hypothetical protein